MQGFLTHRTHWRNYISHNAWGHLEIPQEEQEDVAGEKDIWAAWLTLLPWRLDSGMWLKNIDGWTVDDAVLVISVLKGQFTPK